MYRTATLLITLLPLASLHAQQVESSRFDAMQYRYIGPEGNRVTTVAGIPGDPRTYYAGAASGGIWKTTDGGTYWEPIFDEQVVQSIGWITVAPSDPNVIWVGTGESNIRSHISLGMGVYRSTDAGKHWTLLGLEHTGRVSRIAVDPRDPDVAFVAAMGHSYGPQPERGIFRTRDGGRTWEHVLFVDENTGASDLVMDPNNPRILFAGMWQLEIHTWGRESGGPGSGIYMSRDGGDTWTKLEGTGLPTKPVGKIALAIAPTNSDRIYALIETGDGVPWHGRETESGELWRSDDGGEHWLLVSHDRNLAGRTHYYSRVEVSPVDDMEAYFLSASFATTLNGGADAVVSEGRSAPWGDNHDIWIDPMNADRLALANDGGLDISLNRGVTWRRVELPIAQMYHVTVDNRIPYYVYGNRQDGQSARGPSRTFYDGFLGSVGNIPRGAWHDVGGGESGFATPDPEDPNIVWSSASGSGAIGGIVTRMDLESQQVHNVEVWPKSTIGWPAGELEYRFVWDPPLTISPHDHDRVYTGSQYVHVTTNGGRSWQVISPDLTRNDTTRMGLSGGLTPDNIGVEYAGVVFAIEESPVTPGLIWVGTNDGKVHVTRDAGTTWTDVTRNLPGLPIWGSIRNIEASRYDAGTAYLAVDGHQANNRDPWLYRTRDYGRSWDLIVNGIPKSPLSYTHAIAEDPVRRGLLYAGTENGLYVSFTGGDGWQPLQSNLPHAPVYWLVVQEHFNDLVVGTYGRGFWILDDITPLQQLTPEVAAGSRAHLFTPRPVYRFRATVPPYASFQDPTAGRNPPDGASINYYLPSESGDSVTITIVDREGATVRSMKGGASAGMNRVWWDLREAESLEPRLRTSPLHAPWVEVGDSGWRPAPGLGTMSLLVPPGWYTVKLEVDGQELEQSIEVRKDPNSRGSESEIAEQYRLATELRDDLDRAVTVINGAESIRGQLRALRRTHDGEGARDAWEAALALEEQFTAAEAKLYQLRLTGHGQDGVRWPTRIAQQVAYLTRSVESSDFAPTSQHQAVHAELHGEVLAVQEEYEGLIRNELATFNAMLASRGLQGVVPRN
ncbi:MAG TPA: hypothetical protein VGA22_09680 [Gemmatimonadales bacterium]|jgi:photosystem II stability/assembly factor-like uncharacterized protein